MASLSAACPHWMETTHVDSSQNRGLIPSVVLFAIEKFFAIASLAAILACACADVSELSGYHYHPHHYSAPSHSYIPPAATAPEPVFAPAPAPAPVYQPAPAAAAPAPVYYQPAPAASQIYEQPAEDGYRYRTVRRRVYRQRRL
ncbi:PREDICTED: uncharacterized protein LOC108362520 [Rhagoletis zephyria]|uniref:uncharacterized protein LOC108362520 n=1 Tax=Rhagoletis zephyria TaxID=28612 RepID=UPI00081131F9|nr:PREDICTED: uncharacterized protein LOC108362520 [Rhagoletis zephyria]